MQKQNPGQGNLAGIFLGCFNVLVDHGPGGTQHAG